MELINSRIGEILGLPVLEYDLKRVCINLEGQTYTTLACISKDYTCDVQKSLSFEKYYRLHRSSTKELPLDFIKRLGLDTLIYNQFIYDYIICNMDRHERNNEILINTKGNMSLAPFFDNSLTLILLHLHEASSMLGYNDNSMVNNYIGHKNLLKNLYIIDKRVIIKSPVNTDRNRLFQGLGKVLTREERDYIWTMFMRRVQDVKDKKIPFINWG